MTKMGDSEILEKILAISRRLLLVKMDGLNPIPRKGTTRRECYRALFEIQELLRENGRDKTDFPQLRDEQAYKEDRDG